MNDMDKSWIRMSLNAGGQLSVKNVMPGKSIFRGTMSWPYEEKQADVSGEISTSLSGALDNLNHALQEDAAQEMIDRGVV
jgi:hypothetical protein